MTGISTIIITLALVFYTIGVWSERFAGRLKPWHLVFFWLDVVKDQKTFPIQLHTPRQLLQLQ